MALTAGPLRTPPACAGCTALERSAAGWRAASQIAGTGRDVYGQSTFNSAAVVGDLAPSSSSPCTSSPQGPGGGGGVVWCDGH